MNEKLASLLETVQRTAVQAGDAAAGAAYSVGKAAGELLSKLIRKYPGLAADFGGGRRIMQRPRVARIATQDAQETADDLQGVF